MTPIDAHEHAAEDQALAAQPYSTDFGSLPYGVPPGTRLDDYSDEPPDDVINHFRQLGLTAGHTNP